MIERFLKLLSERVVPTESQGEREATLDLLVWMMFADRHVAAAETTRIETEARAMRWDAAAPVDQYINKSMLRAREVLAGDRPAERYLDELAERLGDEASCARALHACEALAHADGEVAEAERELLGRFAERLASS